MQAGLVQPVSAHADSDEVAQELLHDDIGVEDELVVLDGDLSLLEDSDFIKRHIWSQLVLQAIYLNKLLVELLLISMELHELLRPFVLESRPISDI